MSNSVWPHRWQPTRLPHPWDSPGKNTGVGCHFLLQCREVKSEGEVAQSCQTLRNPMDYSLPGSSTHGIFLAKKKQWTVIDTRNKWLCWRTNNNKPHEKSYTVRFHVYKTRKYVLRKYIHDRQRRRVKGEWWITERHDGTSRGDANLPKLRW